MPRKASDTTLNTRTARLRLPVRREPHWRAIQEGRAIGYRRLAGGRAGTWIARYYDPKTGRLYRAIGSADDLLDADGTDTLTFAQAQNRASDWFVEVMQAAGKIETPKTVKDAVTAYLADYTARGGKALDQLTETFDAHVLPTLGDVLLKDLTASAIRKWLNALATSPARRRTSSKTAPPAKPAKPRKITLSADAMRARRATANRILTPLKAALNHAFREGMVASDSAWRRVQPFENVDAAKVRYLADDEATRLVNACPADLRRLVTAALLTGCRLGELVKLVATDIDLKTGVLTPRDTKSGKDRHVTLTDEGRRFFTNLTAGKAGAALLLVRDDGAAWGANHHTRPLATACDAAKIAPAASFHILRHTHASRLAMRGVPMPVIAAQLGHADTKITEKHYAHLSPGYVSAEIRAAFGDLGLVPETNVKPMRKRKG
jgi:integrase